MVPVKYDVDETTLTEYAKEVVKYVRNSDFVVPYSSSPIYLSGKLDWSLNVVSNFWKGAYNGLNGNGDNKSVSAFFKSYAGIS
jgi:hypothetical protein